MDLIRRYQFTKRLLITPKSLSLHPIAELRPIPDIVSGIPTRRIQDESGEGPFQYTLLEDSLIRERTPPDLLWYPRPGWLSEKG